MTKAPHKIAMLLLCAVLILGTASCARSADPKTGYKAGISDPLEGLNRGVFALNNALDVVLLNPICRVYNALLPDFFRAGVHNFMRNLSSPILVGNEILQGDFHQAGVSTARFIINTTAGVGGLMDPAEHVGLHYADADFGQTLGVWGFGDGFYMVLPVIGPSSLRDTVGLAADSYADPVRLWARNTDREWIYYTRVGVSAVDQRARLVKAMDDLRKNSLDYYAAVRSAYAQKRASMIHHGAQAAVNIPDANDHP
jgi:phospholipid-binding lipoprotein MlaA